MVDKKQTLNLIDCWLDGISLPIMSWRRPECASAKKSLRDFVYEKAKVNYEAYYLEKPMPKLVEGCEQLLLNGFVFQQDRASAHTALVTED